ncbi:ankyrin repeat-containing protein At5g02620-like [Pyrus communis]|uniref:ankyrin repeat-containing protein At5g02620-like n=1 Tax=Pyrus communis TaxID=23211 RepID=UPI0035BECD45
MDPNTYKAAAKGKIEIFKEISQQQHLGRLLTPNKNTVVHINIAAQKGGGTDYSTDFVKQVLHIYPSLLLQVNIKGESALHIAARHGHVAAVKVLLEFAKVAQSHGDHTDELESGMVRGVDHEQISVLLRMKSNKNDTALHEAARYNRLGVVQVLTQEDPDFPYSPNEAGETPLYLAAERGYREVVFEMLQTCTSPDHRGPNGRTTLHAAIIFKDGEMARKLLDANWALTKEVDEQGWTALHYAADIGDASIVKQLLQFDKSSAYISDKEGKKTALHVAAGGGHAKVMKELLSNCPDCFELVDNRGWNVLHFAVESNSDDAVKLVLENSLLSNLINEKDAEGNTPLHYAAASLSCISSFIHHPKVDFMAYNKQNLSALDIVLANGSSSEMKEENNEISRGNDNKEENNETSGGNEINSGDEDTKEVNLIVATLIATVTFAAAFTMPGGYINDEGHDQGSAVLVRNAAFRTFVVADTISMMLSSISVLLHLSVVTAKNQQKKEKTFMVESYLITIAMLGMIVAYVTGTYAVLSHSRGIAIATCVIGSALSSLFMFLYYTASKGW